jgi:serine/threonine protein phosphatase 1
MLWAPGRFLGHSAPFEEGVVVVHGHTPVERPEIERNRINVDRGRSTAAD